jgi:hypothetical protein
MSMTESMTESMTKSMTKRMRTRINTERSRSVGRNHMSNANANENANRGPAEIFQTAWITARPVTRCDVCGFAEVRTDEVFDSEVLFLAECPRCQNRWTSREPIGGPLPLAASVRRGSTRMQRVPARVARNVAPAA